MVTSTVACFWIGFWLCVAESRLRYFGERLLIICNETDTFEGNINDKYVRSLSTCIK